MLTLFIRYLTLHWEIVYKRYFFPPAYICISLFALFILAFLPFVFRPLCFTLLRHVYFWVGPAPRNGGSTNGGSVCGQRWLQVLRMAERFMARPVPIYQVAVRPSYSSLLRCVFYQQQTQLPGPASTFVSSAAPSNGVAITRAPDPEPHSHPRIPRSI